MSPNSAFGGYAETFPKGQVEQGCTTQETARREPLEEAGLLVKIVAYLCDVPRTTTMTRYYLANRVGGLPTHMGWESQAVHLVPTLLESTSSALRPWPATNGASAD